jgi:hypothetical protein
MVQADFREQALKTTPSRGRLAAVTLILIDDFSLRLRPTA